MKKFDKRMCSVFIENGMTQLVTPNGEVIPCLIDASLIEPLSDGMNIYQTSLYVNLCSSKEEALKKYNQGK